MVIMISAVDVLVMACTLLRPHSRTTGPPSYRPCTDGTTNSVFGVRYVRRRQPNPEAKSDCPAGSGQQRPDILKKGTHQVEPRLT